MLCYETTLKRVNATNGCANSAYYSQRDYRNEYRPKCDDALRLGGNGRICIIAFVDKRVSGR